MKALYHGSMVSGLNILKPKVRTTIGRQKKARVYATMDIRAAAIFGLWWHNKTARFMYSKGIWTFTILGKVKDSSGSIYVLDSSNFKPTDPSKFEWYSEKSVKVVKEIKVKSLLNYAKQEGVIIKLGL